MAAWTPERTWAAFTARVVVQDDGCWHWTGELNAWGYGHVTVSRKQWKAHRYAYTTQVGPIPDGLDIDHVCHNEDPTCLGGGPSCLHRRCVNPAHLRPATRGDNIRAGKIYQLVDVCRAGHEVTARTLKVRKSDGTHSCRTCDVDRTREWRQARAREKRAG